MPSLHRLIRRSLAPLPVAGLLVLSSCGVEDGLGKRFPVSGTVTYNGSPLEKGAISFVPEEPTGVGASGAIEKGSYTISTGGGDDGARAGKYKVTIIAKEDSASKAKADFEKASGKQDPAMIPKSFLLKAETEAKSLIPLGYGDLRTSTLKAEVKAQSNTIPFTLTDADAPPEPKAAPQRRGGGRGGR